MCASISNTIHPFQVLGLTEGCILSYLSMYHFMYTAPQQSPLEFLNVTVSRTHQNHGLVVQWNLTVLPPQGTIFAYYQIQYQVAGREAVGGGEVKAVQVEANERWVFVNDLEDAQAYEVHCVASME